MTEHEKHLARLRFFSKAFRWGYEAGCVSVAASQAAELLSAGERFGAHERKTQTAAKAYAQLTGAAS